MKKVTKEFDPYSLVPSKKEILEFCDKVITKWKSEPKPNPKNIVAMTTVKTSVYWTDEESLKAIWSEILKWTFELVYKNAIVHAKTENSEWNPALEKIKNKEQKSTNEPDMWY